VELIPESPQHFGQDLKGHEFTAKRTCFHGVLLFGFPNNGLFPKWIPIFDVQLVGFCDCFWYFDTKFVIFPSEACADGRYNVILFLQCVENPLGECGFGCD
jgi:hypothetical protein